MKTWTCACGAVNDVRMRVCDFCGEDQRREQAPPAKTLPDAYREFPARQLVRSAPTDRCTEPGCEKTVAEHRAEFRQHYAKIAAKFAEPGEAPR